MLKQLLKLIPLKKAKLLLNLLDRDANWVEVLIEYFPSDNNIKQAYKIRIEAKGKVMTVNKSAKPMRLVPVRQYHVTNLIKIAS